MGAAKYPKYRKRHDLSVSLTTRVNNCFMRSLYGKPLPGDSREMTAVITYFSWISKDIPIYAEIPWLGLKIIDIDDSPDKKQGAVLFKEVCPRCHGKNGQSGEREGHEQNGPPLWGNGSFSDGAGMSKLKTLPSFAYYNMPRHNPTLKEKEAQAIAAYVTSQPRPHFEDN